MLPKGFLVGHLTADPQSGVAQSTQNVFSRFSVACQDNYSKSSAAARVHYFNCVAWGKRSNFIQSYLKKGDKIFLEFSLSTGSYINQEGKSIKTVDLIVENIESLSHKFSAAAEDKNRNEEVSEESLDDISIEDIYED